MQPDREVVCSGTRQVDSFNERDELGDNLPPDFLTSVREGGFYGWPYSYWGKNEDPHHKGKRRDLVAKAIVPDVSLGAHTASLGLTFYRGDSFPQHYRGMAHGTGRNSAVTRSCSSRFPMGGLQDRWRIS